MEDTGSKFLHGAFGRAVTRLGIKLKHPMSFVGAGWTVLRHMNPFNGNVVSMTVCLALFFALTVLAVFGDAWTMEGALLSDGFIFLTKVISHILGFICISKVFLGIFSPLIFAFSKSERDIICIVDDFRVLYFMIIIVIVFNIFVVALGLSEHEVNVAVHGLLSYLSFPAYFFLLGLVGEPVFLAFAGSGAVLIFVSMILHEYRALRSSD